MLILRGGISVNISAAVKYRISASNQPIAFLNNKSLNLCIEEANLATHSTCDILKFDEIKSLWENLNE